MENINIVLTVQSTGSKEKKLWRLGMSLKDSQKKIIERGLLVNIILGTVSTQAKTVCGPPLKKGFDFNGKVISEWIIKNKYNLYPPRNPTKLIFKYSEKDQRLIFIKKY